MEKIFTVSRAAKAVSGKPINCENITDELIGSVSTDTRTIKDGAVFVALKGENSDGHKYIKKAAELGAICCIVQDGADIPDNIPCIAVADTSQALLDLAAAYRREFKIPVVAVTGSVGKTSTRGMIASVLVQKYKTLATEGNFNNEIGVPHTIFRLDKTHEIAVLEMGMNHFGELARITVAAQPDTAVITNVGEAHIENLGSREGILKAKLEILDGLTHGGTVVLCGDNDLLWGINGSVEFETVYCGINNTRCDLVAENIKVSADGTEFSFKYEDKEYNARISVPGIHHVYNALIAVAIGVKYNVPMNDIICGIREFIPDGMRQAAVKIGNFTVIKDCYNANPTSMRSGLDVLSLAETDGRRVACLGDMMELGTISEQAHLNVGALAAQSKVDCLITVGERAKLIAQGAKDSGMPEDKIFSFDNNDELCAEIGNILKDGDVILLKASRSMKLEQIADYMEKIWSKK